jgi:hypothetical protein
VKCVAVQSRTGTMAEGPDDQDEPEVTAEMIEAGVKALYAEWGYNVPSGEVGLVASVFRAMSRAMRTVSAAPSASNPATR